MFIAADFVSDHRHQLSLTHMSHISCCISLHCTYNPRLDCRSGACVCPIHVPSTPACHVPSLLILKYEASYELLPPLCALIFQALREPRLYDMLGTLAFQATIMPYSLLASACSEPSHFWFQLPFQWRGGEFIVLWEEAARQFDGPDHYTITPLPGGIRRAKDQSCCRQCTCAVPPIKARRV